jgi:hypothetical protein
MLMLTRTILALLLLFPSAATPQDIAKAMSAMVRISGTREGASVRGSGFVVSLDHDRATIVTASHVIQGVQQIEVTFAADATQNFPAPTGGVLGMDADSPNGLAAFQVRGAIPAGVTPLSFEGESQPRPGEALFLLGFPQMERAPRTTQRTLSGRRGTLLLIDQASGEGSSGGPVLQGGKVVGVVTTSDDQTTYAVNETVAYEALEGWGVKFGSPVIDRTILPSVMHFCGGNCFTLVWDHGHYVPRTEHPGDPVDAWTVEAFTRDSVILHRQGPPKPQGLSRFEATYAGQISKEGNRLVNVTMNGSSKNKAQFAWGSALDSVPGSNEERDRAQQKPQP